MIGLKNSKTRYGWGSMALHWAVVITIAACAWYAYSRGFIPREERDARRAIMMMHIDWSWIVTGLVLLRILWRMMTSSPDEINDDRRLALAHKLATGFLAWSPVLITVTGIGVIWSVGRDTLMFGVPVVSGLAERDRELHDIMEVAHVGLWYLFAAVLALHVGAAMWHHVAKKDATLRRMVPWGKVD